MESAVNLFSFNLSFDDIFSDLSKKPLIPVSSSNIAVAKVDVVDVEKVAVAKVDVAKLTKNEEYIIEYFKSNKKIPNKKLYTNNELNIKIYIAGQPDIAPETLELWFKILRLDNIKLYITFNDNRKTYSNDKFTKYAKSNEFKKMNATDYSNHAKLESETFTKTCVAQENLMYNCKFVSIEVIDFTPPTIEHLVILWTELDLFYETKLKNNDIKSNVLMHCTSGNGRSGFMLCSYIWLKKLQEEAKFKDNDNQIFMISTQIIKEKLDKYNAQLDNNYTLYKEILARDVIKFLIKEMTAFEPEIVYELFYLLNSTDISILKQNNNLITYLTEVDYKTDEDKRNAVDLFINRITNFIKAYETYTNTKLLI